MNTPLSWTGSRFGPYELGSRLGSGGTGDVYEAYHTGRGRTVALKLLSRKLTADLAYRERFQRESQAVARLAEPHVVPLHDWGEIDGVLYLDMRLVHGDDLHTILQNLGPIPPPRAVDIIEQVAAALDTAHAAGLVHRNVKPTNILVTPTDFVYLADFGVARAADDTEMTPVDTTIGSYTAPERFGAGVVTGHADIYALACVLYECLTGATPFPAHSVNVSIRAPLSAPPPRPSTQQPGVPVALDEVIARAMAESPDDRYGSAGEFAVAARVATGPPEPESPGPGTLRSGADGDTHGSADSATVQPDPASPGPTTTGTLRVVADARRADSSGDTSDLPVIRPQDPAAVRPSEFEFTPLPPTEARPRWPHTSPSAPSPPATYPLSVPGNHEYPVADRRPEPNAYRSDRESADSDFDPDEHRYGATEYAHPVEAPHEKRYRPARRRPIVGPMVITVLGITVTVAGSVIGWQILGTSPEQQPTITAAPNNSVAYAQPPSTYAQPPSSTAAPKTSTSSTTEVRFPDTATLCATVYPSLGSHTTSAVGTSVTSCAFAEEVRKAYADASRSDTRPGIQHTIVAVSPVTRQVYTMNCTAQGRLVTCTGGENAVVYVL